MRIVVTGGAGFIGCRLVDRLAKDGHDVSSWDIRDLPAGHEGNSAIVDVTDKDAVESGLDGVDVIFHLAGPVLGGVKKDPYGSMMLQTKGTLNVLEGARNKGVKKVVFASSFYVFDGIAEGDAVDENTKLDIFEMDLFGAEKLMSERLVRAFADKYEFEYVILRFGSVYGYGECSNAVKFFLETGFKGESIDIWGTGQRRNQYTYVDDVVDGCVRSMDVANETFNLISDQETSTIELSKILEDGHGFKFTFDETKPEGATMVHMNGAKAGAQMNWEPRDIAVGLGEMIAEMNPEAAEA